MTNNPLANAQRIIVKVGSSTITDEQNGTLRTGWLDSVTADLAALRKQGKQVIVVSSGAVALGKRALGIREKNIPLEQKQAAAAVGQIALTKAWRESFDAHGITVAQLLLTIDESENRRRYLNARNTLATLLELGAVPIINENDTVATAELRFGDNDRLAARVAQMASADALILLSDIDGLYTANPHRDKNAQFIPELRSIDASIEAMAGDSHSDLGSGGMTTKIQAAKIALAAGCHMAIATGAVLHPIRAVQDGGRCTWFIASSTPKSARKHWIAGSINPQGTLIVDDGAATALKSGKSLLPAGVKQAEGQFERGDAVLIKTLTGQIIGKGLSAYSRADTDRILGRKSGEIEEILGYKGRDTLIHRDDMVLE